MNPTETFLVILLAGLATAVALGAVQVSPAILHSSVSQAFLLVMTLVLFAYSPVVGIAAIALFAILMFKRNVQKTTQYTQAVQQFVQDAAKQQEYQDAPYAAVQPQAQQMPPKVSQPRPYTQSFHQEAVPQGVLEGYASPEEVGTYPLGDPRPTNEASHAFTAMYRPAEDMGENAFVATPSTLDVSKSQSFAY